MNKNGKNSTFLELYKNGILIPKIQRDYVQGRKNAQVRKNRRALVEKLKNALEKEEEMRLNFIYGYQENGRFVPIDGQQRLTTLFLLHAYVFARTGALSSFKKMGSFWYDTRETTSRFFEKLLGNDNLANFLRAISSQDMPKNEDEFEEKFVYELEDCAWYSYTWKYDPSIVSCIVMLSEIHRVFQGVDGDELKKKLEEHRYVTFMLLDITQEIGKPNQLYIRMNARGKQLTAFENFKADMYGYLSKTTDLKEHFVSKMDGGWLELLWSIPQNESVSEKYCDIFYRELLHWALVDSLVVRRTNSLKLNIRTRSNAQDFEWLNATKQNYIDEIYLGDYRQLAKEWAADDSLEEALQDVYYTIEGLCKAQELGILVDLVDIKYDEGKKDRRSKKGYYTTNVAGYKSRAILYALKRFAKIYFPMEGCMDDQMGSADDKFKYWVRIMRNLIRNTNYNNPQDLVNTCLYLQSYERDDVEKALKGNLKKDNFPFRQELLIEENYKQKIIYDDARLYDKIIGLEKTNYFDGEIYFAFELADYNNSDLDAVREALERVSELVEMGKDGLLQRALLTYGNYRRCELKENSKTSFYVYSETHHDNDLRALLRRLPNEFKSLYQNYCAQNQSAEEFLKGKIGAYKTDNQNDESLLYYLITEKDMFAYMDHAYVYTYQSGNGQCPHHFLLKSADRDARMVDYKIFALYTRLKREGIKVEFQTNRDKGYYSYIETGSRYVGYKNGEFVNENGVSYAVKSVDEMLEKCK